MEKKETNYDGMSEREIAEAWDRYFSEQDLGDLEDVREFVGMHCAQNADDSPGQNWLEVAIATLGGYLDERDVAHEVFNYYRRPGAKVTTYE